MKINSNFKAFAGMNFDASKYIPSPSYGVNRFMLDRIGSEKARATTIVQYQPNSKFPEHTHIGGEEFLVIEGTFKDQFGEFPVLRRVGGVVIVKVDVEITEIGAVLLADALDELFRGQALLLGAQHDGGAVGVIGADVQAVMAARLLEANPDIRLHLLQHMAKVQGTVGVGKGAGYQDFTCCVGGHGCVVSEWVKKGRYYSVFACSFH